MCFIFPQKKEGTEMEKVKKYRHELKYALSYADYAAMRSRLQKIMKQDPHVSSDGLYLIRSIYFDNSDDKALKEKTDGISRREKFRIRYYNDDLSFITLEKSAEQSMSVMQIDTIFFFVFIY